MSNAIENVVVTLTSEQQVAIRKLALRSTELSASELATKLMSQVLRGRFKAITEKIAEDAASKYDSAVAGGFTPPMERTEYIRKSIDEYRAILSEL